MTASASAHVRRLHGRVARTAARFVDHAARTGASVSDLPALKLPWYTIRNQAADAPSEPATVFVFDEIGGSFGISADDFVRDIEDINASTIHVRINSPGGSLFDAVAMYNALNHHPARIVVYIDSLAASAASIVAMAGDEVVMMPGSQMMIHDAAAVEDGNAADMAKMSTFLDRQSNNIADIYRLRAGGDAAEWRGLMLDETWMFAQEAVDFRLADRIEEAPTPDGERAIEARAFDLSQFRYAGRRNAPTPRRRGSTSMPVTTRPRSEGSAAEMTTVIREAAAARRAGLGDRRQQRSSVAGVAPARLAGFPALNLRAETVERDGREFIRFMGEAVVFNRFYEMWDIYGPYKERVADGAGDETLASGPDVAFLTNHRGITMARTTNRTLELSATSEAVPIVAWTNPERQDVRDLAAAVRDGNITEMSFAFMLPEDGGVWNDDFTEFTITKFDINRGDVSAVNYGANPYTSIAARSREILSDLDHLPASAQRAALRRLEERFAPTGGAIAEEVKRPIVAPSEAKNGTGMSIELAEALFGIDLDN